MTVSQSSTGKTAISTPNAPAPMPVFGQGVRKGGLLQVSGQGSVDPATGSFVGEGDVKAQTRRVLENVLAILEAGGASLEDVVEVGILLANPADFAGLSVTGS